MDTLKRNLFVYADSDDEQAPVGQQAELLRLIYELQYSIEDINTVRESFQTKNILLKRQINQLQRKVLQARKAQKPHLDELNELIALAKKTLIEAKPTVKADRVEPTLYYAKSNS